MIPEQKIILTLQRKPIKISIMDILGYYTRLRIYDIALSYFKATLFVNFDILYGGNPPKDLMSVFEHLQSEGLVKIHENGNEITEKGKLKALSGGFRREFALRVIFMSLTIIGSVAAIISAIVVL